jgi:hypothetical protein
MAKVTTIQGSFRFLGVKPAQHSRPAKVHLETETQHFSGHPRIFGTLADVRDPKLLARLGHEVSNGEEIEVTLETDWDDPDLPQVLTAFARVDAKTLATAA